MNDDDFPRRVGEANAYMLGWRPQDERPTLRESIERAIEAIKSQPYRVCEHVVRPAGIGRQWELCDEREAGAEIIRCASLCGWAAYARPVAANQ